MYKVIICIRTKYIYSGRVGILSFTRLIFGVMLNETFVSMKTVQKLRYK